MKWWEQRDLQVVGSDADGWRVYEPGLHAYVAGPFPSQWQAQSALLLVYQDR